MSTDTDLHDIHLAASERSLLETGLFMWDGPATMTDNVARSLWFDSAGDFMGQIGRLRGALVSSEPLTAMDWHRVLAATEVVFTCWTLGAGGDWSIITGLDDHETLDRLRQVQQKLASVRPWPEPFARPGHAG
jgi:hypothetical protein